MSASPYRRMRNLLRPVRAAPVIDVEAGRLEVEARGGVIVAVGARPEVVAREVRAGPLPQGRGLRLVDEELQLAGEVSRLAGIHGGSHRTGVPHSSATGQRSTRTLWTPSSRFSARTSCSAVPGSRIFAS